MADAETLAAITQLNASVSELRQDITGRLDNMVTRREHDAEVRRIDAELAHQATAQSQHEQGATGRLAHLEATMTAGDKAVLERVEEADQKRQDNRRWLAGWMIGAVGLAVALSQLALRVWAP